MLPAKLDVYEGERLRLDCSVQGFPTPIGLFVFVVAGYGGVGGGVRRKLDVLEGEKLLVDCPGIMPLGQFMCVCQWGGGGLGGGGGCKLDVCKGERL